MRYLIISSDRRRCSSLAEVEVELALPSKPVVEVAKGGRGPSSSGESVVVVDSSVVVVVVVVIITIIVWLW